MMRRTAHLTPEEITAWRDGVRDAAGVEGHILTCEACRMRLAEARLMRHVLRSSRGTPAGNHLDRREIGEYFDTVFLDGKMPAKRLREIEAHLDTCASCLKRLLNLRAHLMPSVALREQVFRRLSTVEGSSGRFKVRIQALLNRIVMEVLAQPVPPAAPEATTGVFHSYLSDATFTSRSMEHLPKFKVMQTAKPLRARERLSWSGSDVDLECIVEKGEARLAVTVTERGTGSSRQGTPISMSGHTTGSLSKGTTDRHGRTSFLLPEEPVIVNIGTEPPLELEIDFQQLAFG
jgi:hypothetical protein